MMKISGVTPTLLFVLIAACSHADKKPAPSTATSPAATAPERAPIELLNGHVVVKGFVNGEGPFRFVVGTFPGSYLDLTVAGQLKLPVRILIPDAKTTSLGISDEARLVVGDHSFQSQSFRVSNLKLFRDQFGIDNLDGLIGLDLLGQSLVKMDLAGKTLQFIKTAGSDLESNEAMPFAMLFDMPVIPISIEGHKVKVLLDLNQQRPFQITRHFADQLRIFAVAKIKATKKRKLRPDEIQPTSTVVRLDKMILPNKVELHNVETTLLPEPDAGPAEVDVAGIIGTPALQELTLIFDFPNRQMRFIRPTVQTK